jgi:hypothetical protein
MNFKEWICRIEEGNQRARPSQGVGNPDMTTGMGPASHFGGPRAMLPISPGIDNRAFAGVMDGIGAARSKIRARKGAEPGVASQYDTLDDIRRSSMQTVNMPLQLPADWSIENNGVIGMSKGLLAQIKSSFGDPLQSSSVYNLDEKGHIKYPSSQGSTRLYIFTKGKDENPAEYDSAVNYTTALMLASLTTRLSQYSHLLNLDRPIDPRDRKVLPFPLKNNQEGAAPQFYYAMMCAFVFSPKNKDSEISDDMYSNIDRIMQQNKNQAGSRQETNPGEAEPRAARPRSNLNAARRAGGRVSRTSPVNTNRGGA